MEDEETDLELISRLMTSTVRESWFQSAHLHLEPEQLVGGLLLAIHDIKGSVPGHDVLERAHKLAVAEMDTPHTPTHTGPVAGHGSGPYL